MIYTFTAPDGKAPDAATLLLPTDDGGQVRFKMGHRDRVCLAGIVLAWLKVEPGLIKDASAFADRILME